MPVKVTCSCGQSLNVPDSLAGKAVKCPKCQKGIRVPGGAPPALTAQQPTTKAQRPPAGSPTAASKPTSAPVRQPTVAPAGSPLTDLFDQAGLTQRQGTFCPSCDKSLPPGTTICVNCGFHLEQGGKIEGFQVINTEFGNKRLNEAAAMMKREAETEKRLLNAGFPWWMLLGILLGILVMAVSILIKMDAKTSGSTSNIAIFAKLQRASYLHVIMMSAGIGASLIANFAALVILVTSFKESAKQGLLCLFAPFYILYYMFSRINTMKIRNVVIIYWVMAILAGVFLAISLPKI